MEVGVKEFASSLFEEVFVFLFLFNPRKRDIKIFWNPQTGKRVLFFKEVKSRLKSFFMA